MSILVTGATGDIGREVLRQLVERGQRPVGFDIAPKTSGIEDFLDRVELVRGDILNPMDLLGIMKKSGPKTVIHLASLLTSDAEERPYEALKVNIMGTANVLEACRLSDVDRVVYASTSSVYGFSDENAVITEDYRKEPENVYGISKYAAEHYGRLYCNKYSLDYVALRLRILLGPRQRRDSGAMKILKVDQLLERIFRGEEAIIPYHPDDKLEVTHPSDAASSISLACFASSLPHTAYNIMSGSFRISEIAKAFELAHTGAAVRAELPKSSTRLPPRRFGKFDISLAKKELGFEPQYDIYRIVKEIVEHERRRAH